MLTRLTRMNAVCEVSAVISLHRLLELSTYTARLGRRDVRGMGPRLVPGAAADTGPHAPPRGVRRGVGDRGVRQALLGGRLHPARQPESARGQPGQAGVRPER